MIFDYETIAAVNECWGMPDSEIRRTGHWISWKHTEGPYSSFGWYYWQEMSAHENT